MPYARIGAFPQRTLHKLANMAAFEFIQDAPGANAFSAGEFTPKADQSKFASIWGRIDGEGQGFFTGHHIQQGIRSADGRAVLRGVEFKDESGKPHEMKHNKAVLREYIVPVEDVKKWNQYERDQGIEKETRLQQSHEARMRRYGLTPQADDFQEEEISVLPEGGQLLHKNKGGRPKGSKNKPAISQTETTTAT